MAKEIGNSSTIKRIIRRYEIKEKFLDGLARIILGVILFSLVGGLGYAASQSIIIALGTVIIVGATLWAAARLLT